MEEIWDAKLMVIAETITLTLESSIVNFLDRLTQKGCREGGREEKDDQAARADIMFPEK